MAFTFKKTQLSGVILITPIVSEDSRGYFLETYHQDNFIHNDITTIFKQDNHSYSLKGVIRGLHFQKSPFAQAKLVRCIKGKIFDVAVDLNKNSETYLQWIGVELSAENKQMLYIPEDFAHGFSVLSDEAEIIYKCSNIYSKTHDGGFRFDDPTLNINWQVEKPLVSDKDLHLPTLVELNLI